MEDRPLALQALALFTEVGFSSHFLCLKSIPFFLNNLEALDHALPLLIDLLQPAATLHLYQDWDAIEQLPDTPP